MVKTVSSTKVNKTREELSSMFINSLKENRLPWNRPWESTTPLLGTHKNCISNKAYSGINAVYLWLVGASKGYTDNRWCTFKQASEQGWKIRKGSKSVPVEYWYIFDAQEKKPITFSQANKIVEKDSNRHHDMLPRFRTYNVFNGSQIEGIPELEVTPIEKVEFTHNEMQVFLQNYLAGAKLSLQESNQASYSPSTDTLYLPRAEMFHTEMDFYLTAMHECAHSTGHPSRLNRNLSGDMKSENYAIEELRAEIASTFIVADCGLSIPDSISDNNKAYVQSWASRIENNPSVLFSAIKDAEKISNYVCERGNLTLAKEKSQEKPRIAEQLKAAQKKAEEQDSSQIGKTIEHSNQER